MLGPVVRGHTQLWRTGRVRSCSAGSRSALLRRACLGLPSEIAVNIQNEPEVFVSWPSPGSNSQKYPSDRSSFSTGRNGLASGRALVFEFLPTALDMLRGMIKRTFPGALCSKPGILGRRAQPH